MCGFHYLLFRVSASVFKAKGLNFSMCEAAVEMAMEVKCVTRSETLQKSKCSSRQHLSHTSLIFLMWRQPSRLQVEACCVMHSNAWMETSVTCAYVTARSTCDTCSRPFLFCERAHTGLTCTQSSPRCNRGSWQCFITKATHMSDTHICEGFAHVHYHLMYTLLPWP